MARERVACLLRIPETFHMPASSVHAESGPETQPVALESPARSILARGRLPRSLHQRIRTHAHGGLIVGLFVEQQDLSARFHITCGPRTQARFLLSCPVVGTERNPNFAPDGTERRSGAGPAWRDSDRRRGSKREAREAMEFMLSTDATAMTADLLFLSLASRPSSHHRARRQTFHVTSRANRKLMALRKSKASHFALLATVDGAGAACACNPPSPTSRTPRPSPRRHPTHGQ